MLRIQYLPEDERAQVQDFRNWVQSDPDSTTRSAPESPIIGLIENSDAATYYEGSTSGTPKESTPEAKKLPQLLNNFLHPPEEPTLLDLAVERPERVVERLEGQSNVLFE